MMLMQKSEIMLLAKCKSLEEVREILGLMLKLQQREAASNFNKKCEVDAIWRDYQRYVSSTYQDDWEKLEESYEERYNELYPSPWDTVIRESRDQIWEQYEGPQDHYVLRCKLLTLQNQKNSEACKNSETSKLSVKMVMKSSFNGSRGFVPMLDGATESDLWRFRRFLAKIRDKIASHYEVLYDPEADEYYTWFPLTEYYKVYHFLFVTLGKYLEYTD